MTLTITFPEHIQAYIERQITEGRFDTEEAVIVDVFEHVVGEADRGEGVPWTPELMDQRTRDAIENSRRGHQVSNDITY